MKDSFCFFNLSIFVFIVGGFWDTQQPNSSKGEKQHDSQKSEPTKNKKKLTLATQSKKDTSPAVEFEAWCTSVLASWSSKIDGEFFSFG